MADLTKRQYELAEDVYRDVFHMLDAEIDCNGELAGTVAAAVKAAFIAALLPQNCPECGASIDPNSEDPHCPTCYADVG